MSDVDAQIVIDAAVGTAQFAASTYITYASKAGLPQFPDVGSSDSKISQSNEGAPMWRYVGRRWRLNCTIIYASDLDEDKDTIGGGGGKGGSGGGATVYSYTAHLAIAVGQTFGNSKSTFNVRKLIANEKPIYFSEKPSKGDGRYDDLNVHEGSTSQGADTTLAVIHPIVPGFRDTAYVVINDLRLEDFGNTIPIQWEAIVEPHEHTALAPYLVSDALKALWASVPDRTLSEIDVTKVGGANGVLTTDGDEIDADGQFEGLGAEGFVTIRKLMDAVMLAYDLLAFDREGVLTVIDRGDEDIRTVSVDHLGDTTERKSDASRPVQITRSPHIALPSAVTVDFKSRKNGYTRDSVTHRTNAVKTTDGANEIKISLPMILPPKAARRIARRMTYQGYRQRERAEVHLPPQYIDIECTDIMAVPITDENRMAYIQVETKTVGANFEVVLEGPVVTSRAIDDDILTAVPASWLNDLNDETFDPADEASSGSDIEGTDIDAYEVPEVVAISANMPPPSDDYNYWIGWFNAHCAYDPVQFWTGGHLWMAHNETGSYQKVDLPFYGGEDPIGILMEDFPVAGSDGAYPSPQATMQVMMLEGELTTVAAPGWVRLWVADEVLAARTFTALTPVSETVSATINGTTPVQVTRSVGDWTTNFVEGHFVRMAGWGEEDNDVFRQIQGVSSTVLSLSGAALTAEGPTSVVFTTDEAGAYEVGPGIQRGIRDTKDHTDTIHTADNKVLLFDRGANTFVWGTTSKLKKTFWFKSVPKGSTVAAETAYSSVLRGECVRPFRPTHLHYLNGTQVGDYVPRYVRWVHSSRSVDDPTASNLHPLLEKKERYKVQVADSLVPGSEFDAPIWEEDLIFDLHDNNRVCQWNFSIANQTSAGLTASDEIWVRVRQTGDINKIGNWSDTLYIDDYTVRAPPTGGMAAETEEIQ